MWFQLNSIWPVLYWPAKVPMYKITLLHFDNCTCHYFVNALLINAACITLQPNWCYLKNQYQLGQNTKPNFINMTHTRLMNFFFICLFLQLCCKYLKANGMLTELTVSRILNLIVMKSKTVLHYREKDFRMTSTSCSNFVVIIIKSILYDEDKDLSNKLGLFWQP